MFKLQFAKEGTVLELTEENFLPLPSKGYNVESSLTSDDGSVEKIELELLEPIPGVKNGTRLKVTPGKLPQIEDDMIVTTMCMSRASQPDGDDKVKAVTFYYYELQSQRMIRMHRQMSARSAIAR